MAGNPRTDQGSQMEHRHRQLCWGCGDLVTGWMYWLFGGWICLLCAQHEDAKEVRHAA